MMIPDRIYRRQMTMTVFAAERSSLTYGSGYERRRSSRHQCHINWTSFQTTTNEFLMSLQTRTFVQWSVECRKRWVCNGEESERCVDNPRQPWNRHYRINSTIVLSTPNSARVVYEWKPSITSMCMVTSPHEASSFLDERAVRPCRCVVFHKKDSTVDFFGSTVDKEFCTRSQRSH